VSAVTIEDRGGGKFGSTSEVSAPIPTTYPPP
jgi:hypothetical protein